MFLRIFFLLCFSWCAFAARIPESVRIDYGLKMHRGFCLQSVGQSTVAATIFNDAYREAMAAGIPPKKLIAIGNLFMWYRKYGRYLNLFDANGRERISDEYWLYSKSAHKRARSDAEKYREAQEIAEIARDLIFALSEITGAVLGVLLVPDITAKVGAGCLGYDGFTRFWTGFNRLKTKNDEIARETRLLLNEAEAAAKADW